MTAIDVLGRLNVPLDAIAEFCARWNLSEFAVFGSMARGDMRPDSDVDVMVDFATGSTRRAFDVLHMKDELEEMFGRKVDLIRKGTVENPFRRASIARDLTLVYAA
jgi:predicted nucleotidyltransferase